MYLVRVFFAEGECDVAVLIRLGVKRIVGLNIISTKIRWI